MAIADVVAATSAVLVARPWLDASIPALSIGVAVVPAWLVLAKLTGLYERDQQSLRHLTVDELSGIFKLSAMIAVAYTASLSLLHDPQADLRTGALVFAAGGIVDFSARAFMRSIWRRAVPPERTLLIGAGPLAKRTYHKLSLFEDAHVTIVASRETCRLDEIEAMPEWLRSVDRIVVAEASVNEEVVAALLAACRRLDIRLSVVPPAAGIFGAAHRLNHLADIPVIEYSTWDVSRSTLLLKRSLDIVVSVAALVLLLPIAATVAAAIRLEDGMPVLFRQRRAGQHGRPFTMFKFRTMAIGSDERDVVKTEHDPRVTTVGRLLRRWSLDEIPQLINVLRGEMSLVGPRPEEIHLADSYPAEHRFVLLVQPGVTGPMQVLGRAKLDYAERLSVERDYVDNISLARDLRILAMTAGAVVSGRGAY